MMGTQDHSCDRWRAWEIEYLTENYLTKGVEHVSGVLNRTPGAVRYRASILGVVNYHPEDRENKEVRIEYNE